MGILNKLRLKAWFPYNRSEILIPSGTILRFSSIRFLPLEGTSLPALHVEYLLSTNGLDEYEGRLQRS